MAHPFPQNRGMLKKNLITALNRLSTPPLPTRPQDEPFWITLAGSLSLAFLLYVTWVST